MIENTVRYGYNDLCIVPAVESNIESRSECDPFYSDGNLPIFASPMSSVVNIENFNLWESNNIIPVLPRNIEFSIRLQYLNQGKWVAFSLSEFKEIFFFGNVIDIYKDKQYNVCVDLANGHMSSLINICKSVKNKYPNVIIMTGNIANPETYKEYCEAGIDYVRCSIGSGSCCTTASNTSVHYPIASLIDEINTIKCNRNSNNQFTTKVIADGGVRNFSDVIKALALGADYVMIGGLFNSILESAGEFISGDNMVMNDTVEYDICKSDNNLSNKLLIKGAFVMKPVTDKLAEYFDSCEGVDVLTYTSDSCRQYYFVFDIYNDNLTEQVKRMILTYNLKKEIFGMSTKKAQCLIKSDCELKTAEGISKIVDVKYTMAQWVENMIDYLKSAMSYCGSRTLIDFIGRQELKVQSPSEIYSVNK